MSNKRNLIEHICAREVLSATGRPTIETTVILSGGLSAVASVPSGTSTGNHEASALLDGGLRFRGLGVLHAVNNVNTLIHDSLIGLSVSDLERLDRIMIELDGTPGKRRLGANAILSVSMACARAAALSANLPLYRFLSPDRPIHLPAPMATVIAGGIQSPSNLCFEDYIYVFEHSDSIMETLEILFELRLVLQELLEQKCGAIPEVGGALAPPIKENHEALDLMLEAIQVIGCENMVSLGIDVAASELYDQSRGTYDLDGTAVGPETLHNIYVKLVSDYPLSYLEDPFHEDDYQNFSRLKHALSHCRVIGDDLFAGRPDRIRVGLEMGAADAVLFKINQLGTVSETMQAAKLAQDGGLSLFASLRSHETDDSFIVDAAVAMGAERIKIGSPVRAERNAKYNRLLAIEQCLKPLQ